jgi:hypothetical protein
MTKSGLFISQVSHRSETIASPVDFKLHDYGTLRKIDNGSVQA